MCAGSSHPIGHHPVQRRYVNRMLEAKALVHERYGDGIMRAIDFTVRVSKRSEGDPERVVITLDGKFLPYRKW